MRVDSFPRAPAHSTPTAKRTPPRRPQTFMPKQRLRNRPQVGLPLLSLDGMAVRKVKQWILRCAACFKTCTEMGKLFCPVCGNASLDRVSCSVNAKTGATYLHLRKNHKVNLRGSKFSIPAPDPTKGRFEGDLLLREDQLLSGIWAQKVMVMMRMNIDDDEH